MTRGLYRIIWHDGYQEKTIETPYAEGAYSEAQAVKKKLIQGGLKSAASSVSVWKKMNF